MSISSDDDDGTLNDDKQKYVNLDQNYNGDTETREPPLLGLTLNIMISATEWFGRLRSHNEKYNLSQWLNDQLPEMISKLSTEDLDLNQIKENLHNCKPSVELKAMEKTALVHEKQAKKTKQEFELLRNYGISCNGFNHVVYHCKVKKKSMKVLKDMGLDTVEELTEFPNPLYKFNAKRPDCDTFIVESLIVAAK